MKETSSYRACYWAMVVGLIWAISLVVMVLLGYFLGLLFGLKLGLSWAEIGTRLKEMGLECAMGGMGSGCLQLRF